MAEVATKERVGAVRGVRVDCISEVGWFDSETQLVDLGKKPGLRSTVVSDQYDLLNVWPPGGSFHCENIAGVCSLVRFTHCDSASSHCIMLDCGWNPSYLRKRLQEEGVVEAIRGGEVEAIVVSHEHFDHFWGISAVLELRPSIDVIVPSGMTARGLQLIQDSGHTGRVIRLPAAAAAAAAGGAGGAGSRHVVAAIPGIPGLLAIHFSEERISYGVRGEVSLGFVVEGKGLALVTGCSHPGVSSIVSAACDTLSGLLGVPVPLHGLYGGLHQSPYGDWDAKHQSAVEALAASLREAGIKCLGCNHCTGVPGVSALLAILGPGIVRSGSGRNGSLSALYIGNGDSFLF
jgi:7,8-dihydropterin-6-yl-methyl-4-(beta-D-ribofuranosyl)aminobenzene 5'-phosphate synthase